MDLTSFIRKHYKAKSGSSEFAYAWITMTLYMVGSIDAYQYQDRMKSLQPQLSTKVIRLKLMSLGYTFNAKMAMLQAVKEKKSIWDLQEKWELSDRDCKKLQITIEEPFMRKQIKQRLKGLPRKFNFDWQGVFADAYADIMKYVKYITYKKLTFIANSHSVHVSEFYSELEESALKSFYKLWPTDKTPLHIANYVKRSVHNKVVNFIKSETTLKRGRKINVGKNKYGEDQFAMIEVNEGRLGKHADADGQAFHYEDLQSESDRSESVFKFEINISIQQLLSKYKSMPKKFAYLMILLGNEDEKFTNWLRDNKLAGPNEDNIDVQERCSPQEFNRYLSKYFHIRETTSNIFLMKIKKQLGYQDDSNKLAA